MYFSCNVSFSSLPVFLPTILSEMGFSNINAQGTLLSPPPFTLTNFLGLTAPPFFLSFIVTISTTYVADRMQQRGIMIIILSIIGGVGYVILATTKAVGPRYFGVFLA